MLSRLLLLLSLLSLSTSFSPPFLSYTRLSHLHLVQPHPTDAFSQTLNTAPSNTKTTKLLQTLPPAVPKILSLATVPGLALLPFLTPASIPVSIIGSLTATTLGVIAKSRLDTSISQTAPALLATLLATNSIDDTTTSQVDAIQTLTKLDDDEWVEIKADMYTLYLDNMLKSETTTTSDVPDLTKLSSLLSLSPITIGLAHYTSSTRVYAAQVMWTATPDLEDPTHPSHMTVSKALYIADRIFGMETSPEAYKYEMTRFAKVFGMKPAEAQARALAVATPFYEKALVTAKSSPGQVSPDILRRARDQIGIPSETAEALHMQCYTTSINELLGADRTKFAPDSAEHLKALRNTLEIGDFEAGRCQEAETIPIYRLSIMDILSDENSKPAASIGKLAIRQAELDLSPEGATAALQSSVKRVMTVTFNKACQFVRVNNGPGVFAECEEMLKFKATVSALAELMVNDDEGYDTLPPLSFFDQPVGDEFDFSSTTKERNGIYKKYIFGLLETNGGVALTANDQDKLEEIRSLLGVSEFEATIVYRDVCGPILKNALEAETADMGDLSDEKKAQLASIVDNLFIADSDVRDFKRSLFTARINEMAGKSKEVISESDSANLVSLMAFLELEESRTRPLIKSVLGPAFKKAVASALGDARVVSQSSRDSLEIDRSRLLLTPDEGKAVWNQVMAERFAPEIKGLVETLQEANKDKDKDKGEDMANGVAADCLKFLDFMLDNDVAVKIEDGFETVETPRTEKKKEKKKRTVTKEKKNGEGVVTKYDVEETYEEETETEVIDKKEVPKFKYEFPVNALGVSALDDKGADSLYRNMVIQSFKGGGLEKQVKENGRLFARSIGFDEKAINLIDGSIGAMVFENYFSTSMKGKTAVDQEDFMFMAQIKEKLGMTDSQIEKLLASTQKNILSKNIERVFAGGTKITGESMRAVREQALSMGIDLKADLGLDNDRLGRMFKIEVGDGIEKGDINAEDGSEKIADIVDSLSMTMDEGETELEKLVFKRAAEIMRDVTADVSRGNDERAMKDLYLYLRYVEFVGGVSVGVELGEGGREQIMDVFRAATFGKPEAVSQCELLESSLA